MKIVTARDSLCSEHSAQEVTYVTIVLDIKQVHPLSLTAVRESCGCVKWACVLEGACDDERPGAVVLYLSPDQAMRCFGSEIVPEPGNVNNCVGELHVRPMTRLNMGVVGDLAVPAGERMTPEDVESFRKSVLGLAKAVGDVELMAIGGFLARVFGTTVERADVRQLIAACEWLGEVAPIGSEPDSSEPS